MTPIIGVTTFRSSAGPGKPIVAGGKYHYEAIIRAGGLPLLIPVGLPEKDLIRICARINGLLITSGPDIYPIFYGEKMHPEVRGIDISRDEMELFLARYVIQEKIPLLGICRGAQIINVSLGGTMYTDVSDQHPNAIHHTCYPDLPYDLLTHTVTLVEGSRLAKIFKSTSIQVNSLHHQGIRDVPTGLHATAFAPDQLVEGIEVQDHPFGIGVQWHPEVLTENQQARALFREFIKSADS